MQRKQSSEPELSLSSWIQPYLRLYLYFVYRTIIPLELLPVGFVF